MMRRIVLLIASSVLGVPPVKMASIWRFALVLAAVAFWPTCPARASLVTFDFDTGTPTLTAGETIPLDQTSGGLTAHFSPQPSMGGFSVQNAGTTFFTLSQLPGNYLYPDSLTPGYLDIAFSQNLTSITLTFATADFEAETEIPATVELTAYETSKASPLGSATAHGTYLGDTFPEGTLSFTSLVPFDLVEIFIPTPASTLDFFVDNIMVTTVSSVPEPNGLVVFGVGLLSFISLRYRRRRSHR